MIFELDEDEPDPEPAPGAASARRQAGRSPALPNPIFCGDLEFRHRFISRKRTSGDFLYYRGCTEERTALLFGDVSGSGQEAARVAEHLRGRFAAWKEEEAPLLEALEGRPSRLLHGLDRELRGLDCGRYATAFAGVLDARRRILHYSIAGQWPMPVLRTVSGVRTLKGSGPPLGMFEDCALKDYRRKLPEHFLLVFCTDGVTQRPDRAMTGARGAAQKPTAAEVRRALVRETTAEAGSDDALVLTVSSRPKKVEKRA